jgi:hypothetical protein
MDSGRHILNEEDKVILDDMKRKLEMGIKLLQDRGVRHANIQIELEWHIKKILKGE